MTDIPAPRVDPQAVASPMDDPAAPLEAYLKALPAVFCHPITDSIAVVCYTVNTCLHVGDLRRAVCAIRARREEVARLTAELAAEKRRFDWAMDAANCLWRWPEDAAGPGERWSAAAGDEAAVTAGDPRTAIDGAMAGRAPDGGTAS